MIVGFVQFRPVQYDVPANIEQIERLLTGVRADLLVLPELANSGYMYDSPSSLTRYSELADGSGPFLAALGRLAASTGGLIVTGFSELTTDTLYNSAVAVDASGVVAHYRKTHLFADEQDLFLPGDTGFRVFNYKGVRIGIMICFDWYFPESARTLALRGAQVITHPSNLVLGHCQTAMVTRSLENRVFSITANRYGRENIGEKSLTFTGASQVLTPLGIRVAEGPMDDDCVALVEIDPAQADNKRPTPRNHLLENRRPEMYG
jgi:predicted amidohydrolase